jgi:hypothetical protein
MPEAPRRRPMPESARERLERAVEMKRATDRPVDRDWKLRRAA